MPDHVGDIQVRDQVLKIGGRRLGGSSLSFVRGKGIG